MTLRPGERMPDYGPANGCPTSRCRTTRAGRGGCPSWRAAIPWRSSASAAGGARRNSATSARWSGCRTSSRSPTPASWRSASTRPRSRRLPGGPRRALDVPLRRRADLAAAARPGGGHRHRPPSLPARAAHARARSAHPPRLPRQNPYERFACKSTSFANEADLQAFPRGGGALARSGEATILRGPVPTARRRLGLQKGRGAASWRANPHSSSAGIGSEIADLQALPRAARPGLEPGTPRFSEVPLRHGVGI